MFLDEPTSGLDAFQAKSVMQALHGLAKRGHTVLSVVHQPRSCIYQMFEQLQVISEGMLIYSGRADDACHYFAELGYLRTPGFNIADFLLDMVSVDNTSREVRMAGIAHCLHITCRCCFHFHCTTLTLQVFCTALRLPVIISHEIVR